ncbi:spermatogenesis-associated serine-rich protein 1 isoform X2 [Ranitomeya variabilis]|uniref:spermatogenesis-associated serine-rich protein 1 isoform X2 n=1 Tax=Ranitomeya variabilis TaxID=490064 RepID=UPI004056D9AB
MLDLQEPLPHKDVVENCNNLLHHGCWNSRYECPFNPEVQEKTSFLPNIPYKLPTYPNCDLDWKPCIRWLPSPRYSEAPLPHIKDAKFPESIRLQRSYPRSSLEAGSEWSFYPNFGCPTTYHVGKRCIIGGVHKSSQVGSHDHTLPMSNGRRKKGNLTRLNLILSFRFKHCPRNQVFRSKSRSIYKAWKKKRETSKISIDGNQPSAPFSLNYLEMDKNKN